MTSYQFEILFTQHQYSVDYTSYTSNIAWIYVDDFAPHSKPTRGIRNTAENQMIPVLCHSNGIFHISSAIQPASTRIRLNPLLLLLWLLLYCTESTAQTRISAHI